MFVYPFIRWWTFGMFWVWPAVTKAAGNIQVWVIVWTYVFLPLSRVLRSWIVRLKPKFTFNFVRNHWAVFQNNYHFTFPPAMYQDSSSSTVLLILGIIVCLEIGKSRLRAVLGLQKNWANTEFPQAPPLVPPFIYIMYKYRTFVYLMKNIDTLSPQFMVGVHSMGFDKCLRTCPQHCGIIQDSHCYIWNRWTTRSYRIAQGTIFSIL